MASDSDHEHIHVQAALGVALIDKYGKELLFIFLFFFFLLVYWSGLPFPSPGDFPDPGIKLGSPALQTDALISELPGKL